MIKAIPNVFAKYTSAETYAKIVDYDCVTDMWEHSVATYGDATAVAVQDASLTFSALDKEVAAFRTVLAEAGVTAGSHVGVYAPNGLAFVKAYLAVTTLGAVAVLLPAHLPREAVFGCSMKFRLSAIAYDARLADNLSLVQERNPAVKCISADETATVATASVRVAPEAPCTIIFTGGTTGASKGALLSNGAVMKGVRNSCYGTWDVFGQRYLLVLPLTHVFGLIRNLLCSLYTGSALFICGNNKDMFRDAAMFRPTIMVMVPALAEMALQLSMKFGKNMLGSDMKTIICGAAFVPPYLIGEYEKLGITLLPGYGLTESANLVSGNPEAKTHSASVGFLYPEIEAQIVDGELWLKGPNMQTCYFGEEAENANAYEDGWFKTGDLVRMDENGLLYITGRKKEIIVLSTGENVSPAELEAKFVVIDAIQDCMVYENERGALELEVFVREPVVKAMGLEDPNAYVEAEIKKINDTLPAFEKITKVVFRENDFVRSPAMKIVRSANGYVKK